MNGHVRQERKPDNSQAETRSVSPGILAARAHESGRATRESAVPAKPSVAPRGDGARPRNHGPMPGSRITGSQSQQTSLLNERSTRAAPTMAKQHAPRTTVSKSSPPALTYHGRRSISALLRARSRHAPSWQKAGDRLQQSGSPLHCCFAGLLAIILNRWHHGRHRD